MCNEIFMGYFIILFEAVPNLLDKSIDKVVMDQAVQAEIGDDVGQH